MSWYWIVLIVIGYFLGYGLVYFIGINTEDDGYFSDDYELIALVWPIMIPLFLIASPFILVRTLVEKIYEKRH